MANKKISDLTAATVPLVGTELFEVVQAGVSLNVAASDIAASFATDAGNILPVANGGTGAATLTGYVKGAGTSALTASATVPFNDIGNNAYGQFIDTATQATLANTPTTMLLNTTVFSAGISIASGSRITFAVDGYYLFNVSLQFANSSTSDAIITVWQRLNGTDIAGSASKIVIPKVGDGGVTVFSTTFLNVVTAGQYIEVVWTSPNAAVSLQYYPAQVNGVAGALFTAPSTPSSIVAAHRVA